MRLTSLTSKKAEEVRNIVVSFCDDLDSNTGELLSGDPTITELNTSDLTISDESVTVLEHIIRGRTVPVTQGVIFTVSGGTSRTDYTIRVSIATSLDQTLIEDVRLRIL